MSETQAPPTELPAQEEVLFDQVGDRHPFAAFQPASQDQQQHLESRRGNHGAPSAMSPDMPEKQSKYSTRLTGAPPP